MYRLYLNETIKCIAKVIGIPVEEGSFALSALLFSYSDVYVRISSINERVAETVFKMGDGSKFLSFKQPQKPKLGGSRTSGLFFDPTAAQ